MRVLRKKPLQIYIEPKQELLLERLAAEKGTSKAEIIRLSIDRYLRDLPLKEDPAIGIIGLGKSGKKDTSEKHDIYIAEHVSGYGKKKRR
ncbi:MAG: CopG family transcriptional regulator [Nitrospirota bacterium]